VDSYAGFLGVRTGCKGGLEAWQCMSKKDCKKKGEVCYKFAGSEKKPGICAKPMGK
jgi:hypothetical protein